METTQFSPRKFYVHVLERVNPSHRHGASFSKTIDYDDLKPIFELLKKAKEYNEKHGTPERQRKIKLEI